MTQDYIGWAHYRADYKQDAGTICVGIECIIEGRCGTVAMLDTGSFYCVMPTPIAADLDLSTTPDPDVPGIQQPQIRAQGNVISGRVHRIEIRIPADEGDALLLDVSCLAAENWYGPFVIGWKAGLEVIGFALDPSEDRFYFRPLS